MSAMIGNWCKMTTSSTGTGTLTLAAVTGYPSINHIASGIYNLSSGTINVQYVIADTVSSNQYEAGIGSYDLSTSVLTRTLPQRTYTGTTYDATAPTALNFATAANMSIMLSPIVERLGLCIPGAPNTSILGASSSTNFHPMNMLTGGSLTAMTADREYYQAIYWHGTQQITSAGVYASAASGSCKIAWFEFSSSGTIGTKILSDVTITLASGISMASVSNFCPPPGWYIQGILPSSTTSLSTMIYLGIPTPFGSETFGKPILGYYRAGSYASGLSGATTSTTALAPGSMAGSSTSHPTAFYKLAA